MSEDLERLRSLNPGAAEELEEQLMMAEIRESVKGKVIAELDRREEAARLTARIAQLEGKLELVTKALHDPTHVAILHSDWWFLRHPLWCRLMDGDCMINGYLSGVPRSDLLVQNGTYVVQMEFSGPEEVDAKATFTEVEKGHDPMMNELKRLGVW